MKEIFDKPIKIQHHPLKRVFDIVFSLFALLLTAPLWLIIVCFIFLSSPGKIFYAQERIGRGGHPFWCYKFRTMFPDAEKRLEFLIKHDTEIRKEWEKNFKLKNDPRITPIGAFLRKTSLDELPQFWNVLKGDLSVVGPRPVVQKEIEKFYHEKAPLILSIRPGLTGLWQISGRNDVASYEKRVQMDEFYVKNQSLLLDFKIIVKTIPAMIHSRGAY